MNVLDDAEVSRVLVIAAHPDDIDFGSAGTIATWTDAGESVSYCLVTSGEAGGSDDVPSVTEANQHVFNLGTLRKECVPHRIVPSGRYPIEDHMI